MALLVKSVQRDELMRAIRKAARGSGTFPPKSRRAGGTGDAVTVVVRELEVLRLLVAGRRNREIAGTLDITEGHGQASCEQHSRGAGGNRPNGGGNAEPCSTRSSSWRCDPARSEPPSLEPEPEPGAPRNISFDISPPPLREIDEPVTSLRFVVAKVVCLF